MLVQWIAVKNWSIGSVLKSAKIVLSIFIEYLHILMLGLIRLIQINMD